MKKLLSSILIAFGFLLLTNQAHAGTVGRSPKDVFVSSYTTGAFLISPAISTNAVGTAAYQPGAVYEVNLASGAASEFEVMFDSGNCQNITAALNAGQATMLGTRLFYSSTTANTTFVFDPPLAFQNGLCVIDSAVTGSAAITYELGRGVSGN